MSARPNVSEREINERVWAEFLVIAETYAIGISMTREIARLTRFLLKKSNSFLVYQLYLIVYK